jgi:hypothetical protein
MDRRRGCAHQSQIPNHGQRSRFARTSTVDIREEFTVLVHVC